MNAVLDIVAPTFEPVVLDSASFYFRDDGINSDKEYHAQIIQISETAFQVDYQYGKRGSKLMHKVRVSGCSSWKARQEFDEIQSERTRGNYKQISLKQLENIYKELAAQGMDKAGLDLFVDVRGKIVSMAEYARKGGSSVREQYPLIASYNASVVMAGIMAGLMGDKPKDVDVKFCANRIHNMLPRQLEDIGIFVGKTDNGQLFKWRGASFQAVEAPEEKSKKKKKAAKPM
jgi:hypothetical protein